MTRRLSDNVVHRGEPGTRDGREQAVTETETGAGTGTRTRIGIGAGTGAESGAETRTEIERRVEGKNSPGAYVVIVEERRVGRRERGGDATE